MHRWYSAGLRIFLSTSFLFIGPPALANQKFCANLLSNQHSHSLPKLIQAYERLIEVALKNRTLELDEIDAMLKDASPFLVPPRGPSERAALQEALKRLEQSMVKQVDPNVLWPTLSLSLVGLRDRYAIQAAHSDAVTKARSQVTPIVTTYKMTVPEGASFFEYSFSPDSTKLIYLATKDYSFHLFDAKTVDLKTSFHDSSFDADGLTLDKRTIVFSTDSRYVAAVTPAHARKIFLFDTQTNHSMAHIVTPQSWWENGVFSQTSIFTPSGKHFITKLGSSLRVFDVVAENETAHEKLKILGFRSAEKLIAAHTLPFFVSLPPAAEALENGYGPSIKWFKESTENFQITKELNLDDHFSPVAAADLAADDSFLVTGTQNGLIYLWNTRSGKLIHSIDDGMRFTVVDLKISPDQKYLAVKTLNFAKKNPYRLKVIDLETYAEVFDSQFTVTFYNDVKWSPDSRHVAVATGVHELSILNLDFL